MGENFFFNDRVDAFHALEFVQCSHGAGRVGVAVVGPDHQAIFAGATHDIGHIVVDLAGNENIVSLEDVLRERSISDSVTNFCLAIDPWHPLGGASIKPQRSFGNVSCSSLMMT